MFISSKPLLKYTIGAALLVLTIAMAVLWIAAGQLAQPTRRPLQAYQGDWFLHPKAHGILLGSELCDYGRVPCLLVAPDANTGPGNRGAILRRQLAEIGSKLLPYGQTRGILVLLHGRNGRKEDLLPVAERFAAAGFKCAIPDLPAHGDSPVSYVRFSTDPFERDIAAHVLEDARRFFHEPDAPAGIWGLSMGGAFAIHAVSDAPNLWRAMIVVSSFDTLQGVVEDKLSPLPAALSGSFSTALAQLTQYRGGSDLHLVRPDRWASHITLPVFIVHGDNDPLISLKHGHRLFESFPGKNKELAIVAGADHYNILVTDMPLYAKMSAWLATYFK